MAVKNAPAPWPTLNSRGGFRGLTTLISNDPSVGLSWLAFYAANRPSEVGRHVTLFTTADPLVQSHKLLTIRGLRKATEGAATFLHGSTTASGTVTCVTLKPGTVIDQVEATLQTATSPDFLVLDLEGLDLKPAESLDLYWRLDRLIRATELPTLVASRGPAYGDEGSYIQAMTVFDAAQIWIRRGATAIPHGPTLDLRVFRRAQLTCQLTIRSNEEDGGFFELR